MEPHRSGPLKQKNKPHKAPKKRTRYNSFRSNSSKASSNSKKSGSSISRIAKKNQLIQLRQLKREEILNEKRGIANAPIFISIIDFSNRSEHLLKLLHNFDPSAIVQRSKHGNYIHLYVPKFNSKFQIAMLDRKDLYSSIDLAKISDFLLIIHSIDVQRFEINNPELIQDDFFTMDAIYNHCLPQTLHAIIGMNDLKTPKQKERVRKTIVEVIQKNYQGLLSHKNQQSQLRSLDTEQDLMKFFFHCSALKRQSKTGSYCSRRSQVLAEEFNFVPNETDGSMGTLQVRGFIRNNSLNVNSLIYIPEFGEFNIDMVKTVPIPYGDKKNRNCAFNFCMRSDPDQRPSLQRENPIKTIFEAEMRAINEDMEQSENKNDSIQKKKVPKGTSDYQAAWILDSEDDEDEEDEDLESQNDDVDGKLTEELQMIEKMKKVTFAPIDDKDEDETYHDCVEDMEQEALDMAKENYDQEIDLEMEREQLEKFKQERLYEMFPDEIDTPVDRPARERFAKYRGLKSFRTSTWDRSENLPSDYSRIFQFENFDRTRRKIFKSQPIGAEIGHYCQVDVLNIPIRLVEYYRQNPQKPLILFELLAHEHKMSVMNVVLKKLPSFTIPVQSKERLVFHVGYRRFAARPIFSAHTTGDKHKYEKFLRTDIACVATLYAPITYPPASVLVYKEFPEDNSQQLVAIGSLLNCSPDRLIIKRYVLSGHPFKINRKHAVVRYMFFNREDILWFRPVELRTKHGRHGHILEPLGTHGHMKCRFDHPLQSQDTVLMYLYKRVFPKWFYEPIEPGRSEPKINLTRNDVTKMENNKMDDKNDFLECSTINSNSAPTTMNIG